MALVSRKQETLAPIAQEITESGGQALSVPADTGKPPARQHFFLSRILYMENRGTQQPLRRTSV